MSNDTRGISVKILGKEYQVNCPQGKQPALIDAAYFLDRKMAEIRNSGRVYGLERIAVMAALNLAHELLAQRNTADDYAQSLKEQLEKLHAKLENSLADNPAPTPTSTATTSKSVATADNSATTEVV